VSLSKKYTKSEPFGQGQQEPQSIDGTDGHQKTLILLFLLQQTMDLDDSSCSLERYSILAPSD